MGAVGEKPKKLMQGRVTEKKKKSCKPEVKKNACLEVGIVDCKRSW